LQASVVGAFRRLVSCTRIEISPRAARQLAQLFQLRRGQNKGLQARDIGDGEISQAFASIASVLA